VTPSNEDILADANDALRAEFAAPRTKARRARHILLTIAYGAVIIGAAVGACVEVLARHGSFLTMVAALFVIGWAGKEMREATDDPTLDAYDEGDAEEDDEPETTGVRVAAEDDATEDDDHHSGEHAAAKGGAK
jgi:hypothetical protein